MNRIRHKSKTREYAIIVVWLQEFLWRNGANHGSRNCESKDSTRLGQSSFFHGIIVNKVPHVEKKIYGSESHKLCNQTSYTFTYNNPRPTETILRDVLTG
jgi:hypothetical protein